MPSIPLINKLSTKAFVFLSIALITVFVVIFLIPGSVGPKSEVSDYFSVQFSDNSTEADVSLTSLTSFNKHLWLDAHIKRPENITDSFKGSLTYDVRLLGDGNVLSDTTHSVDIICNPDQEYCKYFSIAKVSHVKQKSYDLWLQVKTSPFNETDIFMEIRQGYVPKSYTSFEYGFKVTFIVITSLLVVLFVAKLLSVRNSENKRVMPSVEQGWVLLMGCLLWWFNDPDYFRQVNNPTLAGAEFYAFCSVTFLCALFLFWLFMFDSMRLLARSNGDLSLSNVTQNRSTGACFWVPKVALITILWTILIAYSVFQAVMISADPTFSMTESVGSEFVDWFISFIAVFGVIYLVYVLVVFALVFKSFRSTPPPSRFFFVFTIIVLIIVIAGIFGNGLLSANASSMVFLTTSGSANVYVWTLMVLYLPAGVDNSAQSIPEGTPEPVYANNDVALPMPNGGYGNEEAVPTHADVVPNRWDQKQ